MKIHEQPADEACTNGDAVHQIAQPSRLLRLPEVMDRVGLRRSAIYQRMKEGRFPRSRSLGPKCTVWVETEIDAWVQSVEQSPSNKDVCCQISCDGRL
ncbi:MULTISPECIES: AlpA family transcriptional regulator [unclassified Croceicoccus]|uniref:helix-turn-helix transcriptional regulator n=1 Tax=unclassified Croceicoccus TaxID=2629967 RepID=UPI0021064F30|nr:MULTISPECIES: AlpA family transcriptional regulator [unclassified Croceicoccus]